MRRALRAVIGPMAVTTMIIVALSWLLPGIVWGRAIVAVGIFGGIVAGALADKASWRAALARGCVAALTAGVTLWVLGAP